MRRSRIGVACLLLASFPLPESALAVEGVRVPVPAPGSDAWQPLTFRRVERHTRYTPVIADGKPAFRAESECAASALALSLDATTLDRAPLLRWRWKVETALESRDERSRDGDDFAARVYLLFRFEPEGASWFERSRRAIGERLYGAELPGNALNYVWSTREARGAAWTNPHSEYARMVSLGPAERGRWREEEVDVVADYRRQFGDDPPELMGLAIMTDSDNTCSRAAALFSGFEFAARE